MWGVNTSVGMLGFVTTMGVVVEMDVVGNILGDMGDESTRGTRHVEIGTEMALRGSSDVWVRISLAIFGFVRMVDVVVQWW
jgi:hypothetical protein